MHCNMIGAKNRIVAVSPKFVMGMTLVPHARH